MSVSVSSEHWNVLAVRCLHVWIRLFEK